MSKMKTGERMNEGGWVTETEVREGEGDGARKKEGEKQYGGKHKSCG